MLAPLSVLTWLAAAPAAEPPRAAALDFAPLMIGRALTDGQTWERLEELTDGIGPRLSGSEGAARAVTWALARFQRDGVRAHLEPVKVPHWVRGLEEGQLLPAHGRAAPLSLTALGGSAATSADGLTADVVEVGSFDELHELGGRAKGKVVFFNHPMASAEDYGRYAALRSHGAAEAARAGAAAMVIRSLATGSFRDPHTGVTAFDAGTTPIPAAALSVEDAEALHRALAHGGARVHLTLRCEMLPDVDSANVVAEVRGRSRADQVVLVGAHLDSWDLATGAQDDGAGVAMVMEVAHLLASVHPAPRRTVRVVLFMNEENGLAGGKAYARAHADEIPRHVAALEADLGGGRPLGVALRAGPGAEAALAPWLSPLRGLGAGALIPGGEAGGADLSPLREGQVPLVGVMLDATHYFDVHHSAADTLDKVSPAALAQSAAALTWVTYALAESPDPLPRPERVDAPPVRSAPRR